MARGNFIFKKENNRVFITLRERDNAYFLKDKASSECYQVIEFLSTLGLHFTVLVDHNEDYPYFMSERNAEIDVHTLKSSMEDNLSYLVDAWWIPSSDISTTQVVLEIFKIFVVMAMIFAYYHTSIDSRPFFT